MKKRVYTVSDLANETGKSVDDILLFLWDEEIDYPQTPKDIIKVQDFIRIKDKLKIPNKDVLVSLEYWVNILGLSIEEFYILLNDLGVKIDRGKKKLPKGALRKIKTYVENKINTPNVNNVVSIEEESKEDVEEKYSSISENNNHKKFNNGMFEWDTIGHDMELKYLKVEQVLDIHYTLVRDSYEYQEPIDPPGPRDSTILESAVFRQHTSNGLTQKYPTVEMCSAALLHSLIHDHPFHNGNKRTALVSLLVIIDNHGFMLTCSESELFKMVLKIAKHDIVDIKLSDLADREVLCISKWLTRNIRKIEIGELPITARKLKQILSRFGCTFEQNTPGCTMKVFRTIKTKKFLSSPVVLSSNIYYGGDGKEISKHKINRLRKDLNLDEEHGIDSAAFYQESKTLPSDFINRYRRTIKNLSKL